MLELLHKKCRLEHVRNFYICAKSSHCPKINDTGTFDCGCFIKIK